WLGAGRPGVALAVSLRSESRLALRGCRNAFPGFCPAGVESGRARIPPPDGDADLELVPLRLRHNRRLSVYRRPPVLAPAIYSLRTQLADLSQLVRRNPGLPASDYRDRRLFLHRADPDFFLHRQ